MTTRIEVHEALARIVQTPLPQLPEDIAATAGLLQVEMKTLARWYGELGDILSDMTSAHTAVAFSRMPAAKDRTRKVRVLAAQFAGKLAALAADEQD